MVATVTALLYDDLFLKHDTGRHPEAPERLVAITRAVRDAGLPARLAVLPFAAATADEIALVHDRAYIRAVQQLAEGGGGYLDLDTPVSRYSYEAALLAAGAAIAGTNLVIDGPAKNAFALVRPPGHHAGQAQGMGFCLFNNVAVAARCAQRQHGLDRVLIVDYDVHHGNGTQGIFAADPSVLYFSVHEYPHYPGTGGLSEVGTGPGRGFSVNVPLPAGVGDAGYCTVFDELLAPVARHYSPQLIIVSAGFDAHWLDPLGMMNVSIAGFAALAVRLKALAAELCAGRLMFALEGGYAPRALGPAVVATLQVLLGEVPIDPLPPPGRGGEPDVGGIIARVRQIHNLS